MPRAPLRVVVDGPRDPWFNMAVDEAIMLHRGGCEYDTLRVYMWLPSGVSVGRRQDVDEAVDVGEVRRLGFKLVRRPTGGGALLHEEGCEITYSVVLSGDHEVYKLGLPESSAAIARGVVRALAKLGLPAEPRAKGAGGERHQLCYLRSGSSDVLVGGRKISGSAQRRAAGALLQHGTLLLDFHPDLWLRVVRAPGLRPADLARTVTSLRELVGGFSLRSVVEALVEGFVEALSPRDAFRSPLTSEELETAERLYRVKYSSDSWNLRGEDPVPGSVLRT